MKKFIIADTIRQYRDFCNEQGFDSALVFYATSAKEAIIDVLTNESKGIDATIIDIREANETILIKNALDKINKLWQEQKKKTYFKEMKDEMVQD